MNTTNKIPMATLKLKGIKKHPTGIDKHSSIMKHSGIEKHSDNLTPLHKIYGKGH